MEVCRLKFLFVFWGPKEGNWGHRQCGQRDFSCCFSHSLLEVQAPHPASLTYHNNTDGVAGNWFVLLLQSVHFWMKSQPDWCSMLLFLVLVKFASQFSSVQFSHSVVSDSLQPYELQHAKPPCPSLRVHSNSRSSSWWCHPSISSSVVPFSSCPQSLPASESFPMSQLFSWSGQSTGVSALASFLPKKSQGWSPSEWAGWISLQGPIISLPPPFVISY